MAGNFGTPYTTIKAGRTGPRTVPGQVNTPRPQGTTGQEQVYSTPAKGQQAEARATTAPPIFPYDKP